MSTRRAFLSILAAPAIVSATNLMPIKMYLPRLHLDGVTNDLEAWSAMLRGEPVFYKGTRFAPSSSGPLMIPFKGSAVLRLPTGAQTFIPVNRSVKAPKLTLILEQPSAHFSIGNVC